MNHIKKYLTLSIYIIRLEKSINIQEKNLPYLKEEFRFFRELLNLLRLHLIPFVFISLIFIFHPNVIEFFLDNLFIFATISIFFDFILAYKTSNKKVFLVSAFYLILILLYFDNLENILFFMLLNFFIKYLLFLLGGAISFFKIPIIIQYFSFNRKKANFSEFKKFSRAKIKLRKLKNEKNYSLQKITTNKNNMAYILELKNHEDIKKGLMSIMTESELKDIKEEYIDDIISEFLSKENKEHQKEYLDFVFNKNFNIVKITNS